MGDGMAAMRVFEKAPGTGLPGVIARGTLKWPGEKTLSLWGRGQEIAVIPLINSRWDRLVIGRDNAKAMVTMINSAIAK